ncbi:uncharacterized protein LOC124409606 [Diprion similis]|uniref:uncharacterized protein LOC124409606 n=1 Tax=Diprion similis TaxID=362088 RepID=UPI001EF7B3E6|nr:uncharacterized protein LOC124409606 [Diprion similis]XP_046743283.1 uncharacterized protein LOC124409606 [Diprion similis]
MPSIARQRRVNRSKVLAKRGQKFGGNSKIRSFNPLCGKLKTNNRLLAKALSIQKQENQLLFSEKVDLTSQLQTLRLACNKRDMMLTDIQNNAKEMLSMLVTMTNYVTQTIMCCQQYSRKNDTSLQTNTALSTRRESTRRLSTKSPARGVVKPMVSGHTITKPTINLRRVNMSRLNNLLDLSVIQEASSEHHDHSTINTSGTRHTAAITNSSRLGYESERRRRQPERIPVEFVGVDDDEAGTLDRPETRLSGRHSGELPNGRTRKHGKTLISQIQSPSVALCDVSKLLRNSQTINVRTLRNSQGNGDLHRLSNTEENESQNIDAGSSNRNITMQQTKGSRKSFDNTLQTPSNIRKSQTENSSETIQDTLIEPEVEDPLEGPSWLLNRSTTDPSIADTDLENTAQIFSRKHVVRKIDSSDSEKGVGNDSEDDMEFTECINTRQRLAHVPTTKLISNLNHITTSIANRHIQNESIENVALNPVRVVESSNSYEHRGEPSCNLTTNQSDELVTMNRSDEFVTDRRQHYIENEDDDEDTIMLQFAKRPQLSRFNINDLRLPVLNSPVVPPMESNDSEPEVTTTIQRIVQPNGPPNLYDENVENRFSNHVSLQLPRIDEISNIHKPKRPTKKKKLAKNVTFDENESSDSDSELVLKRKLTKPTKLKTVKDPSTAKVLLEKLTDSDMKAKSTTPDECVIDKTTDFDTTNQRMLDSRNSDAVTDSNSSTHSTSEASRSRRPKAPVNLKEPSLRKKLRRNT